jgi:hypothetical protein
MKRNSIIESDASRRRSLRLERIHFFQHFLEFAGLPKLRNQQCFAPKIQLAPRYPFSARKRRTVDVLLQQSECGVKGDVTIWFEL